MNYSIIHIPSFPRFKALSLSDKDSIEGFLQTFEPYCDFQFWAMWHRNIDDSWHISQLHGHFIIRFTDHITGKELCTVLGNNSETGPVVIGLLKYLQNVTLQPQLSLVPEVTVKAINGKHHNFIRLHEDRANADYVYSVGKLVNLHGNEYKSKRSDIKRFWTRYPTAHVREVRLADQHDNTQMETILKKWAKNKPTGNFQREIRTMERVLATEANRKDLFVLGLFMENKLIGFSVNERFNEEWYNGYFGKADRGYEGAYAVLEQETAKHYLALGCKYVNLEQDLGIPGLRKNKLLWRPNKFLKKYSVYPRWGSGFDSLNLQISPQQP